MVQEKNEFNQCGKHDVNSRNIDGVSDAGLVLDDLQIIYGVLVKTKSALY